MPATRKQINANRANGHLRRARSQYRMAADLLANARRWKKVGQPGNLYAEQVRGLVMVARSAARSARHSLRMAEHYRSL